MDAFGLFGKVVAAVLSALLAAFLTELALNLITTITNPSLLDSRNDLLLSTLFSSYLLISSIMEAESTRQAKTERQMWRGLPKTDAMDLVN
jgi:hypothetical protein